MCVTRAPPARRGAAPSTAAANRRPLPVSHLEHERDLGRQPAHHLVLGVDQAQAQARGVDALEEKREGRSAAATRGGRGLAVPVLAHRLVLADVEAGPEVRAQAIEQVVSGVPVG